MQKFLKTCAVSLALCFSSMPIVNISISAKADNIPDFSYLGAVGSLSLKETQEIAKTIYQGIANHKDGIVINTGIDNYTYNEVEDIKNIYNTVISTWDIGILTSRHSLNYQVSTDGWIRIIPVYLENNDNYANVYAELMKELDKIVSGVNSNWSDVEKALYLHEYLAVYYDYDYNNYTDYMDKELQHSAYGMLKKNMAVCEGYTLLYNILLQRVGVQSAMVESIELNHSWNLLYINNAWYHVDVTWDDAYYQHAGLVYHTNFLKTHEEITATGHESKDWIMTTGKSVFDLNISDLYSNSFWNDCNSAIQYYQNQWFAIHCDSETLDTTAWFDLCDFDAKTGTAEITHINSLDAKWARWQVFDKENYYYYGTYVTPVIVNDILYYTTPTDVFAWKDGGVSWLFSLSEEQKQEGYIYGMYAKGNKLYYQVSISAKDEPEIYSYELWEEEPEEIISTTTTTTTTTTKPITTTTTTTTTKPITTTTTTTTTKPVTTTTTTTTTKPVTTTTTTTTTKPITTTTTTTTTKPITTTTTTTTTKPITTTMITTTSTSTSTTTTSTTATTELTSTILYGDVNGDSTLSVQDLIVLRKYLIGKINFTKEDYLCADVLQDNIVNIYDFVILKKMLLES